jgi:hypothetical protein
MKIMTTLIPMMLVFGCYSRDQTDSYNGNSVPASVIDGSIFPSDLKSVSNEDVVKVLEGKIPLKENGNLAILPIGGMYFLDAGYTDKLKEKMKIEFGENKYIGDIVGVPRMLLSSKIDVSSIREMGARLQCENVLVFTAYNDSRYESKLFSKDEFRVSLTIEGVLINVRTGCIPVAVTVDKESVIKEQKADHNNYEFFRRAQRECLSNGIVDICKKINTVLIQVK